MSRKPGRPPKGSTLGSLPSDWRQAIGSFLEFHAAHQGASQGVIEDHRRVLEAFARHASPADAPVHVDQLEARHIDRFLVEHPAPGGRHFATRATKSLRAFLRYRGLLGHLPAALESQVPRIRKYRLAGLPRALGVDDLRRILRATPRQDARDRRDYAMVVMLASYGLRSGEVRALRLDDLRWRDGSIFIHTKKSGSSLVLPITDVVGDALVDYLERGRPPCDYREVFLSLPPARPHPLSQHTVWKIARTAIDRAGVDLRGVAGHAFRHGFASRLVRRGVALDTVADCLGHASSETTFIYTKLNVEDLRSVSLDPREVIP
jgi:integrase/recombinase XerD